jgi:pachytene checkpoint protein 2
LPETSLGSLWDSIILPKALKDRLLSQAAVNFTVRGKVSRSVLPLHGVILLVGPPGTGKTSLARGLANRVAQAFPGSEFQLLEVEPHSLTSSAMGKTQRAVSDLFSQSIAESALQGPTIVLLDEVETLAVDRSKLSLDANPIDIHRATDAVLVQLDMLAESHPNLLFIATSNFPKAVDSAFTSRCDLILEVPLPDKDACEKIVLDCFEGLSETFPKISELTSSPKFSKLVSQCVGLDGRTIRKVIGNGLALSPAVALAPETVTIDDFITAAESARTERNALNK